jgi:Tfp pilus assembly protein PilO
MLTDLYSKSSVTSRMAMMVAATCIAAIGSYNWFITPHVQCLEAAQRYANEISTFEKKSKMLDSKLKIKRIEADRLSKEIASAQRQLFTADDAQRFFAGLEPCAQRLHCTLTSLKQFGDEAIADGNTTCAASGITKSRVSINLAGRYADIITFLAQLPNNSKKIVISPFSLSVYQNDSDMLNCSLVLTIYVINDENSKGTDHNE